MKLDQYAKGRTVLVANDAALPTFSKEKHGVANQPCVLSIPVVATRATTLLAEESPNSGTHLQYCPLNSACIHEPGCGVCADAHHCKFVQQGFPAIDIPCQMSGDKLKSMMNSSGSKPKKRVKLLPSIREESSLGSPRIPVHIIPPGTSRNLPFKRSMIIQTLPDDPRPRSPSPKVHYLDNVDQVVSEYLPYSRFNGVLPVVQGFAPLPCSCCVDRNRDNFRLKWERNHPPPPEPRNELDVDPNPDPGPSNLNSDSNNSSRPDQTPRNAANQSPRLGSIPQHSPRRGEMPENRFKFQPAYRPTDYRRPFPYPLYYLTSDWRRPHWLLAGDQDDHKQLEKTNTAYVMERVLDANIKYDLAMQKLERSLRTSFNDDD